MSVPACPPQTQFYRMSNEWLIPVWDRWDEEGISYEQGWVVEEEASPTGIAYEEEASPTSIAYEEQGSPTSIAYEEPSIAYKQGIADEQGIAYYEQGAADEQGIAYSEQGIAYPGSKRQPLRLLPYNSASKNGLAAACGADDEHDESQDYDVHPGSRIW